MDFFVDLSDEIDFLLDFFSRTFIQKKIFKEER